MPHEQLTFGPAPTVSKPERVAPYQRTSDTSRAGAMRAQPAVCAQCRAYLRLLEHHGYDGLTDNEAADLMDLPRTTINARRNELIKRGDVRKSPLRRDGGHGVRVQVWVAREFYREPDRVRTLD